MKSNKYIQLDVLNSVKLDPASYRINTGDQKTIIANYDPKNFPTQTGKWTYDKTMVSVQLDADTLIMFTAIKGGVSTITYTPDADPSKSVSCQLIIYGASVPLTLIPTSETVHVGDDFYIDILHDNSKDTPTWIYNEDILEKLPDSTDGRVHFKALKETPSDGIPLVCQYAKQMALNTCTVLASAVPTTVSLDPSGILHKKIWDEYYVNIIYDPEDGNKEGKWDGDDEYIELLEDSTPDRAHFKVVKISKDKPAQRTYTCGSSSATHQCYIDYADLQDIKLTPSTESANIGDIITVRLDTVPPYSYIDSTWDYDSEYIKMLNPSNLVYSTDTPSYFKAIALKEVSSTDISFSNSSPDPTKLPIKVHTSLQINDSFISDIKISSQEVIKHIQGDVVFEDLDCNIINIGLKHTDEQSVCTGEWSISNTNLVKMLPSKDPSRYATFKILGAIPDNDKVIISYSTNPSGYYPMTESCSITASSTPIEDVYVRSSVSRAQPGDVIDVTVEYFPLNSVYDGEWDYDPTLFEVVSMTNTKIVLRVLSLGGSGYQRTGSVRFNSKRQLDDPSYSQTPPYDFVQISLYQDN